jgi:hypothetical protein
MRLADVSVYYPLVPVIGWIGCIIGKSLDVQDTPAQ